jgi:ubiquinone biosynthesis monooxygenase Coq7
MNPAPDPAAHPDPAARLSLIDRCLAEADRALRTVFAQPQATRPNPAANQVDSPLDDNRRREVAGLMRVNHVGEICAQALYSGQSLTARDPATRAHLLAAAREETDHLAWCAQRLEELGDRPSLLNPLWYGGAFTIGAVAGLLGERLSLGFVVETERQVEAHLANHLQRLPPEDRRSRLILAQMQADEARHGQSALEAGGADLPAPLPGLMALASRVMKAVAYRV